MVVVVVVLVYVAALLGDQSSKYAGRHVSVTTVERLLSGAVLRRTRFPIGGRLHFF